MRAGKKIVSALLALAILLFSSTISDVYAEDMMEHTFKSTLYGGVIGALLGTAVLLLSDNPDDHLSYIPTGAGVGMLLGASYGIATGSLIYSRSDGEVTRFSFQMPKFQRMKLFDENTNNIEVIDRVDLVRFDF